MGARTRGIGAVVAVAAAAALTVPAAVSAADWPTYGFSVDRAGYNPSETQIGTGNVGTLKRKWARHVGFILDTQPIVAGNVQIKGSTTDVVYAGSEDGRFAAISADTGRVIWKKNLGRTLVKSCPDLPTYGITGAAQLQRSRNSIYVGTGGRLYELNMKTGRTKRRWTLTTNPRHEHNWSALTLSHGRIYVAFAGICDTLPYQGKIVSVNTRTGKRSGTWSVTGAGGGIWSYGGLSADSAGNIFTATGDSSGGSEHAGYAERIVKLSYRLKVRSSNHPGLSGRDADFGATPLLYHAPGCHPQLAVGNKYGNFYVYDRTRIGRGPVQRIRLGGSIRGQKALIGVPAYSPQTRMVYTMNPRRRGKFRPGIVAFRVKKSCHLSKAWNAVGPGKLQSSPTIANGVLYYATGGHGDVIAFNAADGRRLKRFHVGAPIFAAPTVVNGSLYVSAWDGRVYKFAP